jgi:hypothetical protein
MRRDLLMRFVSFHDWIRRIYATRDDELDCDQVADLLATYVDALVAGAEMDGYFRALEQHLAQCPLCLEIAAAMREVVLQESQEPVPVAASMEQC